MVGKTKPASKVEKRRMDTIAVACGCLPCLLDFRPDRHATIQHVISGGRRMGHMATYGACRWHHLADPSWLYYLPDGTRAPHLKEPAYRQRYGTEAELLQIQDFMLVLYMEAPWPDWAVPEAVAIDVRGFAAILRPVIID